MADRRKSAPWAIVVALGLTQIIGWGSMFYAFSLLIEPLRTATGAGTSVVVGAFSIALLASGLAAGSIGHAIDRFGGRWVMGGGSAAGGLLLMALPYVTHVWQLYCIWALLGVAMAATLYEAAFTVLSQVFRERQRKAITALTLFGGFASTVFWPLTQALMQRHGWESAVVILGLLNLLVCAPLHLLMLPSDRADRPRAAVADGNHVELHRILRDPVFYGLCAAFTGNALVFSAMSVHLIPLLQGKGLTLREAAWIGALIGPMQVLGRVLEFTLLSRRSAATVGSLAMWLLPASLVLLAVLNPQLGVLAAFAFLYGTGNGVMTIVRGSIPAELYGRERYGVINGAMATPVLLAKAAGPLFAAVVLSATDGVLAMILSLAGIAAISAVTFMAAASARTRAA
jgi:MFS family permease